jgi:outer membrane usher protein
MLELYLDVVLNGAETGKLARFVQGENGLSASAATLRGLELKWPGSEQARGLVPLAQLAGFGLRHQYHAERQRIVLDAPLELLDRPTVHFPATAAGPQVPVASRAPGLLLNYDLYAQHSHGETSLGNWSELRLFGLGPGVWSTSVSSRLTGPGPHDTIRHDSAWQYDFPQKMLSLTVGDTATSSLAWSRATRIGGVRLSRNFSLQPYRSTAPLASFAGEAVLPSTVDLFIDGIRQSSQQVLPGQFQIDSVPAITGLGQAQMVVTDIHGQVRTLEFALYGAPQLLAPGLTDWSLETGLLRRDYGLRSFAYDDRPLYSATLRRGVSRYLTAEAHAEGRAGLHAGGVGALWMLGERGGVLSASWAASRNDALQGRQTGLGYQWSSRYFNLALDSRRAEAGYRDVASTSGHDSAPPRRTDSAFAGITGRAGQFGLGHVRQDHAGSRARYLSAHWSRGFASGAYLSLNFNRDLEDRRGDSAYLHWSMPLGRQLSAAASVHHADSGLTRSLEARRNIPGDEGGWGWRLQLDDAEGRRSAQAGVGYLGDRGEWSASVRDAAGSDPDGYASASGGLLWMQGKLFAMRRAYDSFALVTTDGVSGVPVRLENRLIGMTDADGVLLVNRLNAWQRNKLSIDPRDLPADLRIGATELQAVPETRGGTVARFPMKRVVSVQLQLRDTGGDLIPAGSPVWLDTADDNEAPLTVTGFDGLVFLQDPPPGAMLRVRHDGSVCRFALPVLPSGGLIQLEGVFCR